VDRFPFSNFQPAPVRCDLGVRYPTVEHAYQAMKTLDRAARERVAALPTPGQAKRAGRTLPLRADWERTKVVAMLDLLRQKFAPGTEHARALLATGDAELVEWNRWHDRTWGKCTCERCGGEGLNLLGLALMRVRAELRQPPANG
jgi:ribA/ribD-fused uncharacterized protein